MASLTRSQLKTSSNNTYDTNGVGGITAAEARLFNNDLIDSLITNDLTSSMVVLSASFASNAGTVGGQTLTSLNQFTASQDTKNSTLASYTGSNDITNTAQNNRLTNLESKSASVDISITNINQFTASNGNTSLNQFTSSADNRLNNLETNSASVNISISNLNSTTASQGISISNLNAATSSYAISSSVAAVDAAQQSQINSLIAASGSYLTSSTSLQSLNSFTQSQYVSNSFFATTGSNTFIGNQRITGSLSVTSSTQIGFKVIGTILTNPSILIGAGGGSDISLTGHDLNINLGGGIKINTNLAGNGIGIEGPDPTIALRDTTSPLNAYIALINKNARLEIVDANGTIVTMNTASFNIPSASFTASIQQGYAWVGNSNGVSVAVATSSFAGGSSTDITALNAFTASQDTKNSTLATYTGSNDTKWNTLGTQTGSFVTETESGSFLITASVNLNTITFTKGNNTTFAVTVNTGSAITTDITSLNSFTASQDTKNSTIATYTGSNDTKWSNLGAQSGSFVTESETGSFARTNVDNNFTANQTFTNITAVSASFQYIQTTYETASVIYSSGSNQFGDELTDIQTLSGSVKVQGSLTVNGTPVQTSSVDITSLNSFTASQETKNSTLATYTASVNSSLTNINSFTSSNGNTSLNSYTASNDTKWSNLAGQTGSYVTSAITASSLITASFNNGTRNLTFTKGDASTFAVNIPDVSGSAGNFVTTASFNAYTASNDQRVSSLEVNSASVNTSISNINTATASLFTSASLGLTTASFSGNTLTFTKGDSSTFGVVIPDISGSTINTGSFATTGSNTFIGDQTITGSLFISGNINMVNGADIVTHHVRAQGSNGLELQTAAGAIIVSMGAGGGTQAAFVGAVTANSISASTINGIGNVTNYSTSVDSRLDNLEAATSSYVTSAITASSLITASVNLNTITFTKGDASTFSLTVDTGSGATLPSGLLSSSVTNFVNYSASVDSRINGIVAGTGFATTGSNTFRGNETFEDAAGNASTLVPTSGSLMLVAKSFTSASSHISGTTNLVNLIFKNNDNTADTIISGSGNMFINPAAPTAGFKRYVGGSGNIMLNASNVPQISSSMQFSPTMNNNHFGSNGTSLIMRGPVSSSTYTISGNSILGNVTIGSSATLHAEKLTSGLTMTGNTIVGTLSIVANQSALTGSTTSITNTYIAGTPRLDLSSSAVTLANNIINDAGFVFTNQFYSSSVGLGTVALNRNNIGGQNNAIIISGSLPAGTNTANSISDNFIFGSANTIYIDVANARVSGTNAYINVIRTGLMGNSLIVSGSGLLSDPSTLGSVFVGRYNANDNIRNKSSDTVFAVGTGNSTTRKTGFLIDSGSNTFVEGTLNVSGSSNFNGNVSVTGSLLVNGIAISVVNTGSFVTTASFNTYTSSQAVLNAGFATTGSNSFNGNQRITGSLTMSGSIITVDRSGETGNLYMGQNALGMGGAGAQPLAEGNTISVAIGNGAMRFASGSSQNIAIGNNALLITTGSKNFGMGSEALSSNTTGQQNVGIGTSALTKNTTGESNVAIGDSAGFNVSGSNNTFIGSNSGYNISGSNNTILGRYQGSAGELLTNNIILANGQGTIKAQYSGSAWSFQDEIKLNKGNNKTTDVVTLTTDSTGSATLSNSLINSSSIILLTQKAPSDRICHDTTFTAGSFGGIATWFECGGYISSSLELGMNEVMTICGKHVSLTGAGSLITTGSRCGAGGVWIKGEPTSNSVPIGSNVFSSSMMVQYLIINPTT